MLKRKFDTLYKEVKTLTKLENDLDKQLTQIENELKKVSEDISYKEELCKLQYYKLQIYEREFKDLNFCDDIFNIIFDYSLVCAVSFNGMRYNEDRNVEHKFTLNQNDQNEFLLSPSLLKSESLEPPIFWYYFFGGVTKNYSALKIYQSYNESTKITYPLNLNIIFGKEFKMLDFSDTKIFEVEINNCTDYFKEFVLD